MIKLWREFRAWVEAKKEEREKNLEKRIREMVNSIKYPESPYSVSSIIEEVRRHDRRGIKP